MEKHENISILKLPFFYLQLQKLSRVRIIEFASDKLNFLLKILGYVVAQLVEALSYKPEGRRFDSRWCHWNFSLT